MPEKYVAITLNCILSRTKNNNCNKTIDILSFIILYYVSMILYTNGLLGLERETDIEERDKTSGGNQGGM